MRNQRFMNINRVPPRRKYTVPSLRKNHFLQGYTTGSPINDFSLRDCDACLFSLGIPIELKSSHTHTHGFIIHEALTGVPYLWFYWRKFGPRRGGGSGSYGFLFDSLIGRLISFRKESAGAREPDVTFGISFTFFISRDGNNKNNAYIWPWTFFTMDKGISN